MFSKASTPPTKAPAKKSDAPPSIISSDLSVTGDILSEGEVQIEGAVDGDVKCVKLTIGVTGSVKGAVEAEHILVRGSVTGQIKASVVSLAKTSHVCGDVMHEKLAIESGAYLDGNCRRIDAPPTVAEPRINLVVGDIGPA